MNQNLRGSERVQDDRTRRCVGAELANQIDFDTIANTFSVNNLVGTLGVTPANFAALGAVGQRMDELAMPQDARCLILGPPAYWAMAAGLSGLFVRSVAEPALKGFLVNIASFDIYEDQNVQSITTGNFAGTGVVSTSNQTGSM